MAVPRRLFAACAVVQLSILFILGSTRHTLLALQLAPDAATARNVARTWSADDADRFLTHFYLDLWYPALYGLFLYHCVDGADPIRWGTVLSVLLWNTSGYDSVGALAAEVRNPGRDLPRALVVTNVLVTLVYLLPLALAISLDVDNVRSWSDGDFVMVASQHIGDWLAAWITLGGSLSALGKSHKQFFPTHWSRPTDHPTLHFTN